MFEDDDEDDDVMAKKAALKSLADHIGAGEEDADEGVEGGWDTSKFKSEKKKKKSGGGGGMGGGMGGMDMSSIAGMMG